MRSVAIMSVLLLGIGACSEAPRPTVPVTTAVPVSEPVGSDNPDNDEGHRASSPNDSVEQQKNPTDAEITGNIQQQMMDSKMSANLRNVKVATQDGKVTLNGLVKTIEEKQVVEDIAQSVAGDGNVWSKLEVEQ